MLTKNLDRVMIALSICDKRHQMFNGEMYGLKDLGQDYETISDDIYYMLSEPKVQQKLSTSPWFTKLQKTYKNVN